MNAPATIQQRTVAQVLLDLKEARDDYVTAVIDLGMARKGSSEEADADDRATEADQRVDALRDEFADLFRASTGLTWKEVETAVQDAVL